MQVRIYDMTTMTCRQELFGHKDIVLCMDACLYSQQRMILASGGKDHMVIMYWSMFAR
jgi:U3 small nucleolar RNA-associated protein 13